MNPPHASCLRVLCVGLYLYLLCVYVVVCACLCVRVCMCRLASGTFVQALQKMSAANVQDTASGGKARGISGIGGGGGEEAGDEGGEGAGDEGLSEGGAWLKMLDCIVDALPCPSESISGGELGCAAGEEGQGDGDEDGAKKRIANQVALACQRECAALVEGLLQVHLESGVQDEQR